MNNRSETDSSHPHLTRRTDRRTNRTRRLLKEALFALILEKGYDAVTIEDITERADLGRTTFYLHYRDKEELLLESIDAIAEDLLEQIAPVQPIVWDEQAWVTNNPGAPIQIVFQHAADNAALYRIILRGEGATRAANRVHKIISQIVAGAIKTSIEKEISIDPQLPVEIFANYFAGALLANITWWLEDGMHYSPEEMAEMFRQMFFQGGRKMLGLE